MQEYVAMLFIIQAENNSKWWEMTTDDNEQEQRLRHKEAQIGDKLDDWRTNWS